MGSIAHELAHYECWLGGEDLTEDEEENYAVRYAEWLVGAYACTRAHP